MRTSHKKQQEFLSLVLVSSVLLASTANAQQDPPPADHQVRRELEVANEAWQQRSFDSAYKHFHAAAELADKVENLAVEQRRVLKARCFYNSACAAARSEHMVGNAESDLKKALESGFADFAMLNNEKCFAKLRSDKKFQAWFEAFWDRRIAAKLKNYQALKPTALGLAKSEKTQILKDIKSAGVLTQGQSRPELVVYWNAEHEAETRCLARILSAIREYDCRINVVLVNSGRTEKDMWLGDVRRYSRRYRCDFQTRWRDPASVSQQTTRSLLCFVTADRESLTVCDAKISEAQIDLQCLTLLKRNQQKNTVPDKTEKSKTTPTREFF